MKDESNNYLLSLLFILEQLLLSKFLRNYTPAALWKNPKHLVEIPKIVSISWISTKWTSINKCTFLLSTFAQTITVWPKTFLKFLNRGACIPLPWPLPLWHFLPYCWFTELREVNFLLADNYITDSLLPSIKDFQKSKVSFHQSKLSFHFIGLKGLLRANVLIVQSHKTLAIALSSLKS